ncbi:MAG: hypothetical protein WAQ98_26920 [Blastocatellia bacterium]
MYKVILILLFLIFPAIVLAQEPPPPSPISEPEQRPVFSIGETISRSRIAVAEKEHREMISASSEMNHLARSLLRISQTQCQFSVDDKKKIEKIEKLAKKVRSEQGAGGNKLENKPENVYIALERLHKATQIIEKESRKVNRHSVSLVLIEQVNEVLGLTKEIKKMNDN